MIGHTRKIVDPEIQGYYICRRESISTLDDDDDVLKIDGRMLVISDEENRTLRYSKV